MAEKSARRAVDCEPSPLLCYRYRLRVMFAVGPSLVVILKNPSLADAVRSDPTAGKVEAWAARAGFGGVTYVNLFAFRSPYPTALNGVSYPEAVGPENDFAIECALARADIAVAAWGNPNGIALAFYKRRITEVLALIAKQGKHPLYTVGGLTKQGYPRHGLHWNGSAELRVLNQCLSTSSYDSNTGS